MPEPDPPGIFPVVQSFPGEIAAGDPDLSNREAEMGIPNPLPQLRGIYRELTRRRVVHAVAVYAVVAWVVIQVTAIIFPALYLPDWALTAVVGLAVLGFPITFVLSWLFRIGPGGVRRRTPDPGRAVALGRGARTFLMLGVVGITGALGWIGWDRWLQPRLAASAEVSAEPAESELDPARVAVLYFDDHSRDGSLAPFAAGLTEDLIHRLAQVEVLEVISRHGVKPYRTASISVDSIARALGAGSLVEGSVQSSGDELEVTVQLIDGRTQAHLMSAVLRRPEGELFELEHRLAEEVSRLLRHRLGREIRLQSRQAGTGSVEAWKLVQRAGRMESDIRWLVDAGDDRAAGRLAVEADSLLAEAEALDRDWNEPRVARAELVATVVNPYAPRWSPRDLTRIRDGLEHAARAVERDPEDPAALTARGRLRYWLSRHLEDRDRSRDLLATAEADLRRAVALDPSSARAWYGLSELLLGRGRATEALYAARRAHEADAFLTMPADTYLGLYEAAINRPDYEQGDRWCRAGQEDHPDRVEFWACELILLASDGAAAPDVDRAWRLVEEIRARARPRNASFFAAIARRQVAAVLARSGRPDSALAVLERARPADPAGASPQVAYEEAHVLLLLGEEERALDRLVRFLDEMPQYADRIRSDPWFEPLREHPRFRTVVGR